MILLVLMWPQQLWAGVVGDFQLQTFASQVADLSSDGRADHLARLFHIPGNLSSQRRERERTTLARTLHRVFRTFGLPQTGEWTEGTLDADIIWVESLNADYWQDRNRYNQLTRRVRYAQAGQGWLVVRVVIYDHRLQLRSLGFALPKGRLTQNLRNTLMEQDPSHE